MGSCKTRLVAGCAWDAQGLEEQGFVWLGACRAPPGVLNQPGNLSRGEEKPFEAAPAAAVTPKLL